MVSPTGVVTLLSGINPTVEAAVSPVIFSSRRDARGENGTHSPQADPGRLSKILGADAGGVTDLTGVVRGKQPEGQT